MRVLTESNFVVLAPGNHHLVRSCTDLYGAALGVRDLISQRHTYPHVRSDVTQWSQLTSVRSHTVWFHCMQLAH